MLTSALKKFVSPRMSWPSTPGAITARNWTSIGACGSLCGCEAQVRRQPAHASPHAELVAWVSQDLGVCVKPLTADEWTGLLANARLQDITFRIHPVEAKKEAGLLVQRYGVWSLVTSTFRALGLYIRNPAYRKFVQDIRQGGIIPENLAEHFGYGIYVGRKE